MHTKQNSNKKEHIHWQRNRWPTLGGLGAGPVAPAGPLLGGCEVVPLLDDIPHKETSTYCTKVLVKGERPQSQFGRFTFMAVDFL